MGKGKWNDKGGMIKCLKGRNEDGEYSRKCY